ncbi:hypothetical protein BGZ94_009055 [Podila epigama]|nr:hypothetical protein BGZ94_009055 [Podila epigama]
MAKALKKDSRTRRRVKNQEPKKKKRKNKKDPNAPKTPRSAYMLFYEEWDSPVRAEHPKASLSMRYQEMHIAAKTQYQAEKAAFEQHKAEASDVVPEENM